MSEMVDRVQAAITRLAAEIGCDVGEGEIFARAAIEAMRNPAEEMIEASARAGFGGDRIFPTAYWNAGIEAALKD